MRRKERKAQEKEVEALKKEVLEKIRKGNFIGEEWVKRCFAERDIASVASWMIELGFEGDIIARLKNVRVW